MPALADNPLYHPAWPPAFDRIRPEHVVPAVQALLEEAETAFAAAEAAAAPTWEAAVEAVDASGRPLGDAWRIVSHLMGVQNSPELREAHEQVLPGLVQYGLRTGQSKAIFQALEGLAASPGFADEPSARRRVVESRLREMRLAGVALEGEARERFNAIATELSELSTAFSNNVLDSTKAWERIIDDRSELDGLSEDEFSLLAQSYAREHGDGAPSADGPWRLSLDGPAMRPILENCTNRELREAVYRAYVTRASSGDHDNADNVRRILALRAEKAALLGYETYAELAMTRKMADVEGAQKLLEDLREASWGPGSTDLDELRSFAAANGHEGELAPWDLRFWRTRLREERFEFTSEELRPYFPMPRVLDGLFSLVERIFGIRVVAADGEVPVWDDDVRYFRVLDGDDEIAAFYLDPYARPANKRGGAWMADARGRRVIDGNVELPVAYLTCNGTPPVGDRPSLMTFDEVETLFHEFGHGLQHMLTTVDVEDVAGIGGVEWDAVELPSQFMENWCYHRPTVQGMTAHVDTGEPLPDALFDKIVAARTFFSGSDFLRQLYFGLTDLALHTHPDPAGLDPIAVQREVSERTNHIPPIDEDRSLYAFGHIFAGGYAAGYYSYKWAEVLSADAFGAFEEAGLDDAVAVAGVGRTFRDTVLALGGSVDPTEVYRAFRGRDATIDALLRHNALAA